VEQGYTPDTDQLSMETEISEQSINRVANTMFETLSLDEIGYNSHYENISIIDVFENSDSADPKTLVANEKIQETIQQSIKALDERESFILKSYFGLEGYEEKNYSEIAKVVGISRERVRQILKIALKKIFNRVYPVKVMSYEL
jgi:RNA polymerase primary sigma factor